MPYKRGYGGFPMSYPVPRVYIRPDIRPPKLIRIRADSGSGVSYPGYLIRCGALCAIRKLGYHTLTLPQTTWKDDIDGTSTSDKCALQPRYCTSDYAATHSTLASCLLSIVLERTCPDSYGILVMDTMVQEPRTPTRPATYQHHKCSTETPVRIRSVHTSKYRSGKLEPMREAALEELGDAIPEINLSSFMEHLLPPLKDGISIPDVISHLEEAGHIVSNASRRRFLKGFEVIPSKRKESEDVVFAPLVEICESACHAVSRSAGLPQSNFILTSLPNFAPVSERMGRTRPDASFGIRHKMEEFARVAIGRRGDTKDERKAKKKCRGEIKEAGQTPSWYDIGVPEELKKNASDWKDNAKKIAFHMQQILSLDACRRFTFGITIEDQNMRLWFFSRSHSLVSKQFDFTGEIETLLRVFLSFAFAAKEELGWDPTIQGYDKICENGCKERMYHIEVGDRKYETVNVYSELAADASLSTASRVWKVIDIETKEPFVLKDIWIEDDRQPEHIIYNKVLDDVEKLFNDVEGIREKVASHLLTPVEHCMVRINGEDDHTTNVIMRGYTPPVFDVFPLVADEGPIVSMRSSIGAPSAGDRNRFKNKSKSYQLRECGPRKHYRVVFKEIARPIHTLERLSDVFIVLKDAAQVLKWIHGAGWVHRDISAENLYLFDGRGIIGDLEYATRKDSTSVPHHVRTGSADFMASEVIERQYRYAPLSRMQGADDIADGSLQKERTDPSFRHNEIHDLESLWWIAVFVLFVNRHRTQSGESDERFDVEQETMSLLIFPRSDTITDRVLFFDRKTHFSNRLAWMPEMLSNIIVSLNSLREILLRRYSSFEETYPSFSLGALDGIQDKLVEEFSACKKYSNDILLVPCKMTGFQLPDDKDAMQVDPGSPSPSQPVIGPGILTFNTMPGPSRLVSVPPSSEEFTRHSLKGKNKRIRSGIGPEKGNCKRKRSAKI